MHPNDISSQKNAFRPRRVVTIGKICYKKSMLLSEQHAFFMKAREMHTFILYGAFDYHAEMMIIVN